MWADSVTLPLDVDAHGPSPALPSGQPRPATELAPRSPPLPLPGSGCVRWKEARGPRPRPQRPGTLSPPGEARAGRHLVAFAVPAPRPHPVSARTVLLSFQSFNFTCSQLPRAPLGRALKCAECGALSAAAATSEAASNAMLVPLIVRPPAGLCSPQLHFVCFKLFLSFLSSLPSTPGGLGSPCPPSPCSGTSFPALPPPLPGQAPPVHPPGPRGIRLTGGQGAGPGLGPREHGQLVAVISVWSRWGRSALHECAGVRRVCVCVSVTNLNGSARGRRDLGNRTCWGSWLVC